MSADIPKATDTAYHEAGHAVAGYLFGRRYSSVSVHGDIQFERAPRDTHDAIITEVIVTLAGPRAEAQATTSPAMKTYMELGGMHWSAFGGGGTDSDYDIAQRLLQLLWPDDVAAQQRECRQLCTRTEQLLDASSWAWAAVTALATELCERETLTGEEATEIIQKALKEADA